jgi:hypothetical protein
MPARSSPGSDSAPHRTIACAWMGVEPARRAATCSPPLSAGATRTTHHGAGRRAVRWEPPPALVARRFHLPFAKSRTYIAPPIATPSAARDHANQAVIASAPQSHARVGQRDRAVDGVSEVAGGGVEGGLCPQPTSKNKRGRASRVLFSDPMFFFSCRSASRSAAAPITQRPLWASGQLRRPAGRRRPASQSRGPGEVNHVEVTRTRRCRGRSYSMISISIVPTRTGGLRLVASLRVADLEVDALHRGARQGRREVKLSPAEHSIPYTLAAVVGEVVSHRELAKALGFALSDTTRSPAMCPPCAGSWATMPRVPVTWRPSPASATGWWRHEPVGHATERGFRSQRGIGAGLQYFRTTSGSSASTGWRRYSGR